LDNNQGSIVMNFMKSYRGITTVIIAAASLFGVPRAQAATYYWDSNTTSAGFGTAGEMRGSDTNWTPDFTGAFGGSRTTTTTSDALNFGAAANGLASGTITVGTVRAGSLAFATQQTDTGNGGERVYLNDDWAVWIISWEERGVTYTHLQMERATPN
jgi:hypothetical protein